MFYMSVEEYIETMPADEWFDLTIDFYLEEDE